MLLSSAWSWWATPEGLNHPLPAGYFHLVVLHNTGLFGTIWEGFKKSTTKNCRDVFGRADSPPLFCFFRDGWLDDDPCTSGDLVAWVASVGPTAGGTCFATARAGFLATFLDPSKEAERDPSSYSFLLAVLFGWLLGGWKLNWLQFSDQGKNRIHMRINKLELSQRKSDVIWI